jgi:hypothetical protein
MEESIDDFFKETIDYGTTFDLLTDLEIYYNKEIEELKNILIKQNLELLNCSMSLTFMCGKKYKDFDQKNVTETLELKMQDLGNKIKLNLNKKIDYKKKITSSNTYFI